MILAAKINGRDYLVVDMDPGQNGTAGQIVTFWHDYGSRKVKAKNLPELMETFLVGVEEGIYEMSRHGLRRE